MTEVRTRGISPKVWAPVAVQLAALIVSLIASGEFDRTELAQLVGVALTALIGYMASPGDVTGPETPPPGGGQ